MKFIFCRAKTVSATTSCFHFAVQNKGQGQEESNKKRRLSLQLSSLAASVDNNEGNESGMDEDGSALFQPAKGGSGAVRDNMEQEVENAERAAARYYAVDGDDDDGTATAPAPNLGKSGTKNRHMPTHQDMVDLVDCVTDKLAATKERTDQLMEIGRQIIESHKQAVESNQQVRQATNHTNCPASPHTKRYKLMREVRGNEEIIAVLEKRVRQMRDDGEPDSAIRNILDRINLYEQSSLSLEKEMFGRKAV